MRIVVIVSDTFRYDYVGANGNPWIRTPELDAFSKIAVNFDNYWISSFPTIPTRTDWFTGTYGFPFYGWKPLDPKAVILPQCLGQLGYVNQYIGDCPHTMHSQNFFNRGFHGWDWIRGQEGDTPYTWLNHPIVELQPEDKTRKTPRPFGAALVNKHRWQNRWWDSEDDTFVARTCAAATHWLQHNYKAERFLLWMECFDVHEPWDPPEYLWRHYDPDYSGPEMMHPNYGPATDYTKAELRDLQAHYAGEVTLVSKHVGRVLRMIEDCGILDDTLIVFHADHGTYVGEHNRCGKTNICDHDDRGEWPHYNEVAHIPLLMHVPGVKGGRRMKQLVQPPDIMPTLLELAGGDVPPSVTGQSFAGLLTGERQAWTRKAAYSAAAIGGDGKRGSKVTVTDAKWSLILPPSGGGSVELYSRADDPAQKKNLARQQPEIVAKLRRGFIRWLRDLEVDEAKIALYSE